jgi:endogenous inhibitor of DNA gyrase (YacG/DUF329 family)
MEKLNRDFFGEKNPNYKNAGNKICICCGNSYHSYQKTRKYCAHSCYVKDQKERIVQSALIGAISPRKKRQKLGYKLNCKFCNIEFRSITRKYYCKDHKEEAKKAQSLNSGRKKDPTKHLLANCLFCKKEFEFYKSSPQQFCSYQCHLDSGGAWRAGMAATKATMKYGAKKDANHHEVVKALQQAGAYVIDMSHVGKGFPDLIVGFQLKTILMEIKNPKTAYGRKGLNKNQLIWKEQWTGGNFYVVKSPEEALRVIGVL